MVKYGKLYRELQIKEFQGNYIDYKKLKRKIKQMQKLLPRISKEIIPKRTSNDTTIKLNLATSFLEEDYSRYASNASSIGDKYGVHFKEFCELLNQEFQRCYNFFKKIKKQLHTKINKHLYTQTSYSNYNIEQIINELGNLRITIYLAKSLNAFINDNMMAIKKIIKKFDKKFFNYYGNFGPKYILDNLCKENSDFEYLLQFKIIDEASCIIESNTKLLRDYFLELINSSKNINIDKNNFYQKYNEILGFIKDIDELIYFKIQYKEWFYFRKKDKLVSSESKLYKNIKFNPILFSAYHKDDLMHKFLSRKEEIKDIEYMQIPISFKNKINIILIFIHTFFYNTLISGIYPLLFYSIDKEYINYSFLIISSTYICSYFSILFYYYFGLKRIKCAYIVSYIIFFISSLLYILSYKNNSDDQAYTIIGLFVASRILIGLGANPIMGKNYILSYASKYFLPLISKYYVLISILGHSFGPLIEFLLYYRDKDNKPLFLNIYYSYHNCIGWYGLMMSGFLLIINLFFFTSPDSKGFHKLKKKKNSSSKQRFSNREIPFLTDDFEDTQDKEYYKLQKEMKNKISIDFKEEEDEKTIKSESNLNKISKIMTNEDLIESKKNENIIKEELPIKKSNTIEEINIDMNILNPIYDINPLLIYNDNNLEDDTNNDKENGNFENVNMIPRTIDDLIRKEKKKFSYLNRNLLTILIILYFDNLLKENFISYCTYYISLKKDSDFIFEQRYFCCLISCSYLLEILSMFFILPFYKINTKLKKFLVLLMISTILLMIPLLFEQIGLVFYFIIISCIILLSSIIEILSSCYLAYLTPPEWKLSKFNAGSLPLHISTFGKLSGCLICLTVFVKKELDLLNHWVVMIFTIIGYGVSGIYILKSKNFRIKSIARIMRKSELESNLY